MEIPQLYSYFLQSTGVCTDTRKITEGCLFVALKGDNFDANTFAATALENGAKYALISNPEFAVQGKTFLVDNTLTALQELARYHRQQLGLPVIALTGSNGKTTTKELINVVLATKYKTTATIGNLNNHIGVPLTLLSFTKDTEIGIVEMGANHQQEIAFLCNIAEPNFGYITNFGKAHLEGFGGIEGVIKGKSELYDYLTTHTKTAFVNLDDPIQAEKTGNISRYTFSAQRHNSDVTVQAIEANPMVSLYYKDFHIQSNLIGIYNAANITAAIAIGNFFKVPDNFIKQAIEAYTPTNNRSQITEKNGNKIILDAYNANPSSMAAAIANFKQLEAKNRIAFLGDMFELGTESPEEHKKVVALLQGQEEIETYFVGKDFHANAASQPNLHFFESFEALKEHMKNKTFTGNTILIKGSRGMALERILELL